MIDPQAKPAPYIKLLGLVVVLGLLCALVTFAFMALVQQGTHLLWDQAAQALGLDTRLFTVVICAFGGLLVGLLVKLFGDHNAIFAELMQEFGRTGRFDYRNAPGIVITAFVSLIAGASLGPEAPLADACGGIGTLMSDRLKLNERETRTMGYSGVSGMLAAFITSPFSGAVLGLESAQGGPGGLQTYFWVLFPSLLASAVATVVFVLLSGAFFETLYKFPAYMPRVVDMFYAAPLGLIGGAVGLLFMLSLKRLQRPFQPMKAHVVLRGLLGGLAMGLIGALLPLTLFSGEEQTTDLITHAAEIGVLMLIVLGVASDTAGLNRTYCSRMRAALCGDEADIGIDVAGSAEFREGYPVHRVFNVEELHQALELAGTATWPRLLRCSGLSRRPSPRAWAAPFILWTRETSMSFHRQ